MTACAAASQIFTALPVDTYTFYIYYDCRRRSKSGVSPDRIAGSNPDVREVFQSDVKP